MLNTAVLMGRLTADPELRHTPNNLAVTSFTLAVDRSYVKSGAERQTDFIDVVAWRSTAEFVCRYFHKGQLVAVQGSIQTRSYTDREGIKRKAFEIVADNVHFAESKRDNYGNSAQNAGGYQQGYSNNGGYQQPSMNGSAHPEMEPSSSFSTGDTGDFEEIPTDDDLPF